MQLIKFGKIEECGKQLQFFNFVVDLTDSDITGPEAILKLVIERFQHALTDEQKSNEEWRKRSIKQKEVPQSFFRKYIGPK